MDDDIIYWEAQREAMYNAFKFNEARRQAHCQHQWSSTAPYRCVKCAKAK